MSRKERHRQFYRDAEEDPDSELEEEEEEDIRVSQSTALSSEQEASIPSLQSVGTSVPQNKDETEEGDNGEELDVTLLEDTDLQTYLQEMSQMSQQMQTLRKPAKSPTPSPPKTPPRMVPSGVPPVRSKYGGITPPNVGRYRNPITGSPNLERMRTDVESRETRDTLPATLAQKGRDYRKELYAHELGRKDRKKQLLSSLPGFRYSPAEQHYLPRDDAPPLPDSNPSFQWRPLRHASPFAPDRFDRKFQQSVRDMQVERWRSAIMPRGRVGFGDISAYDLQEMRRSLTQGNINDLNVPNVTHETPVHWNPKEVAFSHRLRQLSPEDRSLYLDFQSESNPDVEVNRAAVRQLVPPPTRYQLTKLGDKRVKQYRADTTKTQRMSRQAKRSYVANRARLPSTINAMDDPPIIRPIGESEDQPYTYETYASDPETNRIWTTRSKEEYLQKEQQKRLKREEERKKKYHDEYGD